MRIAIDLNPDRDHEGRYPPDEWDVLYMIARRRGLPEEQTMKTMAANGVSVVVEVDGGWKGMRRRDDSDR